jgi:hypothetical protein
MKLTAALALAAAPAVAFQAGAAPKAARVQLRAQEGGLPDVPPAAVAAGVLAGALALSIGSAALGDGIVRLGAPFGGEVLVPGAPFQTNNGYLGMWNWEKQGGAQVPADQTAEGQKALMAQFQADRKKFDVEAQGKGFKSAEARGVEEKTQKVAQKEAEAKAKAAAKAAAATAAK